MKLVFMLYLIRLNFQTFKRTARRNQTMVQLYFHLSKGNTNVAYVTINVSKVIEEHKVFYCWYTITATGRAAVPLLYIVSCRSFISFLDKLVAR